jgi:hypothetical protein
MGGGEGFGDVVRVAEEEVSGVNEDGGGLVGGVGVFGFDFEAPEDAFRKGLADGEALGGVRGAGAEVEIGLDEEDFAADAGKVDDAALAQLAAVEADIVGTEAVGQLVEEEDVVVGLGDFHEELAGMGVPKEGEEAGAGFETGDAGGNGGLSRSGLGPEGRLQSRGRDGKEGSKENGGRFHSGKRPHVCQSTAGSRREERGNGEFSWVAAGRRGYSAM